MTILEKKKKVTKKFQALGISLDKKKTKHNIERNLTFQQITHTFHIQLFNV